MRRRVSYAALLAVLLAGCAPSEEESAALGRYLLQSLTYARQMADTVMIQTLFRPDATYDDFANQVEYRGTDEIVDYLTLSHEWGEDVYVNLGNVLTGPESAVGEWFFVAVQNGPVPDLLTVATGREVALSGVTVIEIEGGLISRAADYSDRATMMLQLGARIEFPDGSVLVEDGSLN